MSDEIDRRAFGATVMAGAALAATMLSPGQANAQQRGAGARGAGHPQSTLLATPAEKTLVPLPFAAGSLDGLSERLITSHHDNNYAAAVRKLNEIRTQLNSADPSQAGGYWSLYGSLKAAELAARNSSLLHELYFGNLAPHEQAPAPVAEMISQRFGSMERFTALMRGAGQAASGWVVLVADPTSRTLEIVSTEGHAFGAWEAAPLLVLDVFEHAFAIDFGANKGGYIDAFFRNVKWSEVATRATRAIGRMT
jgi:Fe-Mn family superoxide dismutase